MIMFQVSLNLEDWRTWTWMTARWWTARCFMAATKATLAMEMIASLNRVLAATWRTEERRLVMKLRRLVVLSSSRVSMRVLVAGAAMVD